MCVLLTANSYTCVIPHYSELFMQTKSMCNQCTLISSSYTDIVQPHVFNVHGTHIINEGNALMSSASVMLLHAIKLRRTDLQERNEQMETLFCSQHIQSEVILLNTLILISNQYCQVFISIVNSINTVRCGVIYSGQYIILF